MSTGANILGGMRGVYLIQCIHYHCFVYVIYFRATTNGELQNGGDASAKNDTVQNEKVIMYIDYIPIYITRMSFLHHLAYSFFGKNILS